MSLCKWCFERDDSPDDATRLTKGQDCVRCGMSYTEERGVLSDSESLDDYLVSDGGGGE